MVTRSNVTVVGLAQTRADLAKAAAAIVAAAKVAEDEAAEALANDMRSRAPVDEGELRDDIGVRDGATGKEVGSLSVEHGPLVEFGTEDTPAQPFATPAAEAERQQFPGRVETSVKRAVG